MKKNEFRLEKKLNNYTWEVIVMKKNDLRLVKKLNNHTWEVIYINDLDIERQIVEHTDYIDEDTDGEGLLLNSYSRRFPNKKQRDLYINLLINTGYEI